MTPQEQAAFDAMWEALQLAHTALEAIADEMTVGERYTNAGQHLLDSLNPVREALAAANAVSEHVPENNFGNIVQPQECKECAGMGFIDGTGATCETCAGNGQPQAQDDQGLKQFLAAAKDAGITHWNDALTKRLVEAVQPQAQIQFLANGARFKLTSAVGYGAAYLNFPEELIGRWVALVAAENDCHLKLVHSQPKGGDL